MRHRPPTRPLDYGADDGDTAPKDMLACRGTPNAEGLSAELYHRLFMNLFASFLSNHRLQRTFGIG